MNSKARYRPVTNTTFVEIDKVENGYVLTVASKVFICKTPEEVSQQIIAIMVTDRIEKT